MPIEPAQGKKRSFDEFIKSEQSKVHAADENRNEKADNTEVKEIDAIETKTIEMHLNSINESVQRNRSVFLIMTVACSAILFTLWNANFSRLRWSAFDAEKEIQAKPPEPESLAVYGRKTLVAEWYRSRSIQVSPLGIKIDVADLSLMGSFSLVVITLWYFHSQRQANRAINDLLGYVDEQHENNLYIRKMVYQGIIQNAVFSKINESNTETEQGIDTKKKNDTGGGGESGTTNGQSPGTQSNPTLATVPKVGQSDQKTESDLGFLEKRFLKGSDRPVWDLNAKQQIYYGEKRSAKTEESEQSWTDRIVTFLFYLPFVTIVVILLRDIVNLFTASPAAPDGNLIITDIIEETKRAYCGVTGRDWWKIRDFYSVTLLILFDGFAVVCALSTRLLCRECFKFSAANNKTLNIFHNKTLDLEKTNRKRDGSARK